MNSFSLAFLSLLFISASTFGYSQKVNQQIYQKYEKYKEQSIVNRRFKHKDIIHFLQKNKAVLNIEQIGHSVEGRSINKVTIGNGPVKVLLWSQMHGDEPTATMAILDIFNFFIQSDKFDPFRKKIKEQLTLVFIPMLNPDGAEKFKRRNALDFDLNRDAARVQTPEAFVLKETRDQLSPEWGFNLHDQSRYYAAGHTDKLATISFLAPAYNFEKTVNEGRANAMKLIGLLTTNLERYIPGQIAKYNDSFEPRAFGDNIQKWGTNTILIESGGQKNDREKQSIRKLNFSTLLTAFGAIANRQYQNTTIEKYQELPFNRSYAFYDLLLREVFIPLGKEWIKSDIAFRLKERPSSSQQKSFWLEGRITDIGDLSVYHGYQEFKGKGLFCHKGKMFPNMISSTQQFLSLDVTQLWQKGITDLIVSKEIFKKYNQRKLPFTLHLQDKPKAYQLLIGKNPSLYLKNENKISHIIINGQLFKVPKNEISVSSWLNK